MAGKRLVRRNDPVERSAAAWALARRQHGVLARGDLLGLGFSSKAIEHRLATGRLHQIHRSVYAVGRRELGQQGRWMAAVLACDPLALLSHRSAAALWGISSRRTAPELRGTIDVSARRHGKVRRQGIRVRMRPALPTSACTTRRRIPVVTPVQTLIDLATEVSPVELERCVNEADVLDLVDPESLRDALDERSGQGGVPTLRRLLDRHTFRLSDSELETYFRPLAAPDLGPLLTKRIVNGHEVDFYFPALGIVVETDGWRYHRTPSQQTKAARRDQDHTAAGLTPLRFTHYQVRYEPDHVRAVLTRTAANLRRGRPPPPNCATGVQAGRDGVAPPKL